MQPEIERAALGVSRTTTNKEATFEKFSLSNLYKDRTKLKICEKISIHSPGEQLASSIKKANTFANPKYESNQQHGYSNWQTSSTIETYWGHQDNSLSVPRGFLPILLKLCEEHGITPVVEDLRATQPVDFPALVGVTMRPYQARAVNQAMQSDQGVIVSPTGSGKSLIGLELMRQRGQKALIIVHRGELAKQWIDVIQERTSLTAGFIGDGEWTIGDQITVAMVQTIAAKEKRAESLLNAFGLILCDEVHHAPALTFSDVLNLFSAKYRYGLSATPNRRDGLEPMIYQAVGPAIATISKNEVEGSGATVPATAISINTGFNPGPVNSWSAYLDSLTANANRNTIIISLAQQSEGATLVLVDRIAHAEQLSEMLMRCNVDHVIAHGKINRKDRLNVMERIKSAKLTIGTTSLLGEGLDVSVWGTLILGAPISSEIKLMQAVGRVVRPAPGKEKAFVYDLKDDCGFAGSSFKKRLGIYKKHKIWVKFTTHGR